MNEQQKQQRIYNGLCKAHDGFRQVLVSEDFVLRPVILRIQQGYIAKRSTVQVEPVNGDYLFKVEWDKDAEYDTIQQWKDDAWVNVNINNYGELWKRLSREFPWTIDFLARSELSESFMPWDGYTLAEKAKAKKARQFLKTWHIRQFSIDDFIKSPKDGLQYDPIPAPEGLLDTVPRLETLDTHDEVSTRQDHWYMDIGHRIVKVDYNYSEQPSKPLKDIIPSTAKTLIVITEGAYEEEGVFHGIKTNVYTL